MISGLGLPSSIEPLVVALGWLRTPGRDAQPQLALPTDLFMVTVQCGNGEPAPGAEPSTLEIAITLLRTRPESFRSRVAGELTFALLTPAGLLAFLRAPLQGVVDRRLSLARFCRPNELRALRDALLGETNPDVRMAVFGAWIEGRIRQRHQLGTPQRRVAEAAMLIRDRPGPLKLTELRKELRVSQRQLERDFGWWLGLSPAAYSRIVRFQRAAVALAAGSTASACAAEYGYADQAHLTHAFKEFSSLTPRTFVRQARSVRPADRRVLAGRVVLVDAPPTGEPPVGLCR